MTAQDQQSRAALLPCPFCGEPAETIRHGAVSHVRCRQWACGCHGSSTFEYSTEQAIISWNRRAPAAPHKRYRLLVRSVDTIQAGDEFLQDDAVTWQPDPNGTFVGMTYVGNVLLPARRAIEPTL